MRLAILVLLITSTTISAATRMSPREVFVPVKLVEAPKTAPAYVPPPATPPKRKNRSLAEVLRLLERVRVADKGMWFSEVRIDMDGHVKLKAYFHNKPRCYLAPVIHFEAFKTFQKEFRSVRVKSITWESYGKKHIAGHICACHLADKTVAAAEVDIVLNEVSLN